jgi:predicted nucleic acid-binding protein
MGYKVFLDTNIVLDYLIDSREGNRAAKAIMELAVQEEVSCYISPISLLNIYYVLRQQRNEGERKEIIENLISIINVADTDAETIWRGLYLPIADLEDGVQYACAQKVKADYIITRDEQFTACDLAIPRISAAVFVEVVAK